MDINTYVSGITASITNQNQKYAITPGIVGKAFTDLTILIPLVNVVDTYAIMISKGSSPLYTTLYRVKNDENKSYSNSIYLWYADGKRVWLASTDDN